MLGRNRPWLFGIFFILWGRFCTNSLQNENHNACRNTRLGPRNSMLLCTVSNQPDFLSLTVNLQRWIISHTAAVLWCSDSLLYSGASLFNSCFAQEYLLIAPLYRGRVLLKAGTAQSCCANTCPILEYFRAASQSVLEVVKLLRISGTSCSPRCLLYFWVCKGVFQGELPGKKESCLSWENLSLLKLGFLFSYSALLNS